MTSTVLDIQDIELQAGVPFVISKQATYFLIMDGDNIAVKWYRKATLIGDGSGLVGGDGVGPLAEGFDKVELTATVAQTVKIAITSDPVTINRLSGNINSKALAWDGYQGLAQLTFAAAGAQTIPANNDRAALDLVAPPGNTGLIWIGGSAAGTGIALPANGTWSQPVKGAVTVYADTAGDNLMVAEAIS